ncbi:MAG TPA: isoprenylcysteine carboxylmethyltransferase family protein [Anaerolineae bacterium]|nr:isoprenylcysteine carboxylmethyltransferase family protein [Anaerolineae bacterium]
MAGWLLRSIIGTIVYGSIIFLPAGTFNWLWGWVMLGILVAVMIVQPLMLMRINPAVLIEREKSFWTQGVKRWDKWITTIAGGLMPQPWIIAGLDVRFQWTASMQLTVHIGGLIFVVIGHALFLWAMAANAFFSQGARIQSERNQQLVDSGPYRFVRHPGYAGVILYSIATPILLGSMWALIPGILSAILFGVRTRLEDKMLMTELPSYTEFAQRTSFRLLPGVW